MVSAVILAAGIAQRAGEAKFMWPIEGQASLRKIAQEILKTEVSELLVISGFWHTEACKALKGLNVKIYYNALYTEGQSASLRLAVSKLCKNSKAVIFFLADQPFITSHIIMKMINCYRKTGALIVLPSYQGKWKTPTLFDIKKWTADFLKIKGDIGAREIINNNYEKALLLPSEETEIYFLDFDTKEEYENLIFYAGLCRI